MSHGISQDKDPAWRDPHGNSWGWAKLGVSSAGGSGAGDRRRRISSLGMAAGSEDGGSRMERSGCASFSGHSGQEGKVMELVAQPSLSCSLPSRVSTRLPEPGIPCLRSDDDDDVLNPTFEGCSGDFGAIFPAARPLRDLRPLPLSPRALPAPEQLGTSGPCGRHGTHLAGQMWGCTKGSPVVCFHLPVPAQAAGHPQGTHGGPALSRCGTGGGSSARGAREAPRPAGIWPGTRRAVLCLAVLRVEGPYGPLCAGLINPECRSGAVHPAQYSGSRAAEQSQPAGLNPSVPQTYPEGDLRPPHSRG